jgi:hypothetical protein
MLTPRLAMSIMSRKARCFFPFAVIISVICLIPRYWRGDDDAFAGDALDD